MSMEGLFHRLSAVQWFERSQSLIPWFNTLLVMFLAYIFAGIGWHVWLQHSDSAEHGLLVATPMQKDSNSRKDAWLDAVAVMHLFGEADAPQATRVQSVMDAPETRLSLTLRGIVALSAGSEGRALIAEGSAAEKIYQVGDALSGGAVLYEVLADKVILKRGGRFETLTLPRERETFSGVAGAGSTTGKRATGAQNLSRNSSAAMSRQLRTLRNRVVRDPQQAFSLVQATPVMDGGKLKGYRVSPGKKERRLFQGTGLRAGDVVTSVNGISVGDPAQMATLFTQFKSADSFDLVVERGGKQNSLTIDLGK